MNNYVLYMSGARNQQFYIKPETSGIHLKNLNLNIDGGLTVNGVTTTNISTTGTIVASNLIYNTGNNNISGTLTANNLVYNTGNQTISGIKTFANNINVSGTGTFNGLNLENINTLTLSGMNINITGNSILNIFNEVKISGNPVLTGIPDANWASQVEINSLSGSVVFLTGNQTINGLKTFTSGIDIYSGTSPQSIRVFNTTGTNSGEFALIGWQNNNLIIGTQQSQSGVLRDLTLTGNNININASGALNINANLEVNGNVKFGSVVTPTLEMYDGANGYYNKIFWGEKELSFADDSNGDNQVFGILYNDNVNGELTLYSNLGVNGTRLIFPSGKQGYIAIDSEIVHKTGNEIISGVKTFIGNHIISGNTTISGSINISGNYDIYSQIENTKKLAIAYAIAL